nr:SusC/RagA family TonB-linked outer membrane protein [Bacteroidales bacterium]
MKRIFFREDMKKMLLGLWLITVLSGMSISVSGSDPGLKGGHSGRNGSEGSLSPVYQLVVTGTVTDEKGEALAGVNIIEKGTTNGTSTDVNGNYSITTITKEPVLVYSFIGYETQEIIVGNKTTINVVMRESVSGLDEVVVIGYGTARKRDVTGSVVSLSGDVMRDIPSSNISYSLQGRVPGVELSQVSTKPGASMQIRVRGTRSLNASNDPLLVVDGIPFSGSISDLNLNDIKSVDVLKDASATAIYGSRGANGVILITTIKGQDRQKPQISYSSYVGQKTVFAPYPMMNGPEFVALRKAAGKYTNGVDESDDVNIDWQDLFYRKAMTTNHNLAILGGTEKGNYNFSVGYIRDEAVIPGQDFNRFSLRGALDQGIGKFFRFGFVSNNNYSISNGYNLGLYNVLSSSPIANPYNEDGSLKRTIKMPLDENWVQTRKTVEALGDKWIDQTKAFGTYNNLFGEFKVPGIEDLRYRINVGANLRMSTGGSYTGEGVFSYNPTNPSVASVSNSLSTNWVVENLLTYDHTFALKHRLNVVGMYSAEKTHYHSSYISAKDIPADAFQFYNIGRAQGEITVN